MCDDEEELFISGKPNPNRLGFLTIRGPTEAGLDHLTIIGERLGRNLVTIDDEGYEREIYSGIILGERFAYFETISKYIGSKIDIKITVNNMGPTGLKSCSIKSYNPFFGCDVRAFEWLKNGWMAIYEEKHDHYICRFMGNWPPLFEKIEYRWKVTNGVLCYLGYEEKIVRRVNIDGMKFLDPLTIEEAKVKDQFPQDPYA